MGRRGPPKTPTVKLAELGSHRAVSRAGKEPKARDVKPKASIKLTPAERKVFNQICGLLAEMKLRGSPDGNAIARYAKNVVRYNVASDWIEKHGESYPIFDMVDGEKRLRMMKRYPQSVVRHELETTLIRLEREFGLTPAARAGLEVPQSPSAEPDISQFLG